MASLIFDFLVVNTAHGGDGSIHVALLFVLLSHLDEMKEQNKCAS
jgi:hypothetical protein